MAQTPEGKVKDAVKKVLATHGAYYFMPVTGGFGKAGVPDIIGCLNGKFFGIECKARSGTPTALQLREIEKIQSVGGYALIVYPDNIGDVEALCQSLKKT